MFSSDVEIEGATESDAAAAGTRTSHVFVSRPSGAPTNAARHLWPLNAQNTPFIAGGVEFLLLTGAVFGAVVIYHHLIFRHLPSVPFYLITALFLAALFVGPCAFARDYSIKRLLHPKEQMHFAFVRWNVAYSVFVFALFMLQATNFYSRGSIVAQYVVGLGVALLTRLAAARIVSRGLKSGRLGGKKVMVIGEPKAVNHALGRLGREGQGTDIVKVFRIPSAAEDRKLLPAIRKAARETAPDDILINLPWLESERIGALADGLAPLPATIHLAPDPTWSWAQNPVLARVGDAYTIRLARAPLTLRDRFLKRAFDLAVASGMLVAAAPLLALIALTIKLDSPGPVLFRQRRHGFNQREFLVFKFRTMTTLDDGNFIRQATRNDARVTRIGKILRATNLDELPQLFNVLAGDMSLVGPRPHAVAHNNEYEARLRLYARRHKVKPGITGWAQVKGLRGETAAIEKMQARVEHDLFYIDHWSLMFDIKILFMTLFSWRSYRNAY